MITFRIPPIIQVSLKVTRRNRRIHLIGQRNDSKVEVMDSLWEVVVLSNTCLEEFGSSSTIYFKRLISFFYARRRRSYSSVIERHSTNFRVRVRVSAIALPVRRLPGKSQQEHMFEANKIHSFVPWTRG